MKPSSKQFIDQAEKALAAEKAVEFMALGGSMRPVILSGDVLEVRPVESGNVLPGDIVLYKYGKEKCAVHRVIKVLRTGEERAFLLKGDALNSPDTLVEAKDVLGRVDSLKRGSRIMTINRAGYYLPAGIWAYICRQAGFFYPLGRVMRRIFYLAETAYFSILQNTIFVRSLLKRILLSGVEYVEGNVCDAVELAYFYDYDKITDFGAMLRQLEDNLSGKDRNRYVLAKRKGRIIAALSCGNLEGEPEDVWWMHAFKVGRNYRRIGIGSNLVRAMQMLALGNGIKRIKLYVFDDEAAANKVYSNLGFKKTGERSITGPRIRQVLEKDVSSRNNYDCTDRACQSAYKQVILNGILSGKNGPAAHNFFPGIDWEDLFDFSSLHKISPLVYKKLILPYEKELDIPEYLKQKFSNSYYITASRNAVIIHAAKEVLESFNRKKIEVLVLKGGVFAELLYEDAGLRPMTDIDFLIIREDLSSAHELLLGLGYRPAENYEYVISHKKDSSINTLLYSKLSGEQIFIHMHWHIVNSTWPMNKWVKDILMQDIWNRTETVKAGNDEFKTLCPEHQLIYLALHGFTHSFDRFILLADISAFLDKYAGEINWDFMFKEAKRFSLYPIAVGVLFFIQLKSKREFIPDEAERNIKLSLMEKVIVRTMEKGRQGYFFSYLTYLFLQEGVIGKFVFLMRTLFPSKLVMAHLCALPADKIKVKHYFLRLSKVFRI